MAIAAAAVAVVGGVTQAVIAAKKAKKAKDAIKNYKRQELENAYKDVRVSTLASKLQREELARATASGVQALRAGGVRAVVGGVGTIQEQNVLASRAIGADLDRQQRNIDQLRASDEARIRDIRERREENDLAGLGNELNTQRQNTTNGINSAISGVGSLAGAIGNGQGSMGSAGGGAAGGVGGGAVGGSAFLGRTNAQGAFGNNGLAQIDMTQYQMNNNPYIIQQPRIGTGS